MIVYAVFGTAPVWMGRCAYEAEVVQGLVSFCDHPKAFTSLLSLATTIKEKHHERQASTQPGSTDQGHQSDQAGGVDD